MPVAAGRRRLLAAGLATVLVAAGLAATDLARPASAYADSAYPVVDGDYPSPFLGNESTPYTLDDGQCAGRSVMRYLLASTTDGGFDGLGGACDAFISPAEPVAVASSFDADDEFAVGVTPDDTHRIGCGDGDVVVGFGGAQRIGTPSALWLYCATPNPQGTVSPAGSYRTGAIGDTVGATAFDPAFCPAGSYATGMTSQVDAGQVKAVALLCSQVSFRVSYPTRGDIVNTATVGTDSPSFDHQSSTCPTDTMIVRMVLSRTNQHEPFVNNMSAQCYGFAPVTAPVRIRQFRYDPSETAFVGSRIEVDPYFETCEPDEVVVGVHVSVGTSAPTGFSLYCSTPEPDGSLSTAPPDRSLQVGDRTGGTPQDAYCPQGDYTVGMNAASNDAGIQALSLQCAPLSFGPSEPERGTVVAGNGTVGTDSEQYGHQGEQCAPTTALISLAVDVTGEHEPYAGFVVGRCYTFDSVTDPVAVRDVGGAPDNSFGVGDPNVGTGDRGVTHCDPGDVAVGLQGDVGGSAPTAVSLLCSPVAADGAVSVDGAYRSAAIGDVDGNVDQTSLCPDGDYAVGVYAASDTDGVHAMTVLCAPFRFGTPPEPQPANSSWLHATLLDPNDTASEAITTDGAARWYKFPVQPNSQVQVTLTDLPVNDDLTVYSDIGQAFTELDSAADLTQLSAQFAGTAYSPKAWSPKAWSPKAWSPKAWSPKAWSPKAWSPGTDTAGQTTASDTAGLPASVYAPDAFDPASFDPTRSTADTLIPGSYGSTDDLAQAYSSAQFQSLLDVSANEGTADESSTLPTYNSTGFYYVRVLGRNGVAAADPFTLAVKTTGGPCNGLTLKSFAGESTLAPDPGHRTVVLTDTTRQSGSAADVAALQASTAAFATATDATVADVSQSRRIRDLQAQADAHPACPYAQTMVAQAIRDVVSSDRDNNGTLKYVVVLGGDHAIPFFRYADTADVATENLYVPPVVDTSAAQGALRASMVLGQDAYGAATDLAVGGTRLPVPDLAVGRVVETAPEIAAQLDAYVHGAGAPIVPRSSLVTGYDFVTAGARQVEGDLAAGIGAGGRNDTLIDPEGTPQDQAWTATDLASKLFGSSHDVVYLAGHFASESALAADFSTALTTDQVQHSDTSFAHTLVFSTGCHSGYNLQDPDAVPYQTDPLDWAQVMAQKGATLVAGTGYQYGDTDFVAYSNRLYALFARDLREGSGALSIGTVLAQAKRDYLATATNLAGIDEKSVIEATLYGLPMQGVDMPGDRWVRPTPSSVVDPQPVAGGTPGAVLGLKAADLAVTPATTTATKTLANTAGGSVQTTYLTGADGVTTETGKPALPLQAYDVTDLDPTYVLRGVGLRSGTYTDTDGIVPLTGASTTEQSVEHGPFVSPVFYPTRTATPNYFGALTGAGSNGRTTLNVTPAQHRSDAPGSTTDTLRAYSDLGYRLYYSDNLARYGQNQPALAAAPTLTGVTGTLSPDGSTVSLAAHVTGDPSAGVQGVWVTYTGETGGSWHGAWASVDLTQDATDSTLWTATVALPADQPAAGVRFLAQAVNGVGLVGVDDNVGSYHRLITLSAAGSPPVATPTVLTFTSGQATAGAAGDEQQVGAALTDAAGDPLAGRTVRFTLGDATAYAVTGSDGVARSTVPIVATAGTVRVAAWFDGDDTDASSTATSAFTVGKQPVGLRFAPSGAGWTASLTTSSGAPLTRRAVTVAVQPTAGAVPTAVVTLTTDMTGTAYLPRSAVPGWETGVVTGRFGAPNTPLAGTRAVVDQSDPVFATARAVVPPVVSLIVTPSKAAFEAGSTITVDAIGRGPGSRTRSDVTDSTSFTIAPRTDGSATGASCSGNVCTADTAGRYDVTARYGSVSAVVTITVGPSSVVARVAVAPAGTTAVAGNAKPFVVQEFDTWNNLIGDATSRSSFTVVPVAASGMLGTCSANYCTATRAGKYTVRATDGSFTASARLTVTPAATTGLSMPGGMTVAPGQAVTFPVTGVDRYGNRTGDRSSTARFGIAPYSGGSATGASCTGNVCQAQTPGTYRVLARSGSFVVARLFTVSGG